MREKREKNEREERLFLVSSRLCNDADKMIDLDE